MKINKRQFKQWMEALRSGEYSQTTGSLQDHKGFCCLGVACKVLIKKPTLAYSGILEGGLPEYQPNSPKWLKEINIDLEKRMKSVSLEIDNKSYGGVTRMNDRLLLKFDEIADILEAIYIHGVLND